MEVIAFCMCHGSEAWRKQRQERGPRQGKHFAFSNSKLCTLGTHTQSPSSQVSILVPSLYVPNRFTAESCLAGTLSNPPGLPMHAHFRFIQGFNSSFLRFVCLFVRQIIEAWHLLCVRVIHTSETSPCPYAFCTQSSVRPKYLFLKNNILNDPFAIEQGSSFHIYKS